MDWQFWVVAGATAAWGLSMLWGRPRPTVKILKRGIMPRERDWQGVCLICDCHIICKTKDGILLPADPRNLMTERLRVTCPTIGCGQSIYCTEMPMPTLWPREKK